MPWFVWVWGVFWSFVDGWHWFCWKITPVQWFWRSAISVIAGSNFGGQQFRLYFLSFFSCLSLPGVQARVHSFLGFLYWAFKQFWRWVELNPERTASEFCALLLFLIVFSVLFPLFLFLAFFTRCVFPVPHSPVFFLYSFLSILWPVLFPSLVFVLNFLRTAMIPDR